MKTHALQVRAGRVEATLQAPGSKSETHRAFLLAAQSDVPCRVRSPLLSEDTHATLAGLHACGARLHLEEGGDVQFLPAPLRPPRQAIDCRNSGTTLRLLTATSARFGAEVTLTGDASLRARPNGALLDALTSLGARCASQDGRAPISVRGPLHGGPVSLPAGASSQFASALLLALAGTAGPSTIDLQPPLASAPYLDVTLAVARSFGLAIAQEEHPGRRFTLTGPQVPHADSFTVAGDWSAAAFPLVAAAITGGRVAVRGLDPKSAQGDRVIAEHLAHFGASVAIGNGEVVIEGAPLASPGTVDLAATPDLFPALAVLAACSRGTTTFTGGGALRHKESDRIAAMADGLTRMGIAVQQRPDGLVVQGGALHGAAVASHGDHRIHMAFAVAGLAASGTTTVDDPACAAVSYPGFHQALLGTGAPFTLLQGNRATVAP
jgi:3-phosphoshikimate 1-carboxyvinyltransferase